MTAIVFSVGLVMLSFALLCAGSEGSVHGKVAERRLLIAGFVHAATYAERHTASAWENSEIVLKCEASHVIKVMSSSFGRTSKTLCAYHLRQYVGCIHKPCFFDTLQEVANRCDGQKRCEFQVSKHELGDPCPYIKKLLEVNYTCEKSGHLSDEFAYAREGNTVELECPMGQHLHILRASYGPKSGNRKYSGGWDNHIINTWGKLNVKGPLIAQCSQQRICRVKASGEQFKDPYVRTDKYLEVEFRCR